MILKIQQHGRLMSNIITKGFGYNQGLIVKGYRNNIANIVGGAYINISLPTMMGIGVSKPIYVGRSTLYTSPADLFSSTEIFNPIYSANVNLSTNKPIIYTLNNDVVNQFYSGLSNLSIKKIVINGSGGTQVPLYLGSSDLVMEKVLVSYGVNILEGFVYRDTLYITDKFVKTIYM